MVLLLFIVVPVVYGCLVLGICFVLQYFVPFLREERVVVDFCLLLLPLWESVTVLCFVVCYFMSFLVLQSS